MERLNRVYAVLSGINKVIIRTRDPGAVFAAACTIAVEKGGFRAAWIGTLSADGTPQWAAHAGSDTAPSTVRPETLAAQAIAERRTIVADDPGHGQLAALPFSDEGPLAGAFVLAVDEPGFFGKEELDLLEELVGDMGFGLRFSRQENSLRSSEQRFRSLFEFAGDSIFLMDGDVFVACNQKTLEIFGCTRDRIIGRHPYDLSPPTQPDGADSKAEAGRRIAAALSGEMLRFEWQHLRCDGTPFDAEVALSRVDMDGKPYLQAIVRDVTERKRLAAERERLTAIIESTPDYICIATPEGRCTYLNDSFKRILPPKYRAELEAGRALDITVFHPKKAAELVMQTALPYALKHGFWQGENTVLDSQGNEFTVLQTVITHTDAAGKLEYFSVVLRDISATKQREHEMVESELRFRGLVEQAPIHFQIFSSDGLSVMVNAEFLKFWDTTPDQLADYNILKDPQAEAKGVLTFVRRAFAGESVEIPAFPYDPALSGKKGRARWVHSFFYPIKDSRGNVREVVHVAEDVTEEKEAQERSRVSEEHLQREHALFSTAQRAGHIGIWYSDPSNQGKLTWTDETYRIFGLTKETFDGRVETFFKSVHPDDLPMVQEASTKALDPAVRAPYRVEHRIVRPDGKLRWVHQEGDVIWGVDGQPVQFIGVVIDTTAVHGAQATEVRATEMERLNKLMIGRELKMIELKTENDRLKAELAKK